MKYFEISFLRKVSKFYTCSKYWYYLTNKFNKNVEMQSGGKDFSQFRVKDMSSCRLRLGIPEDKFVILYVGKFTKLKGLDLLLQSFKILKEKYSLYLLAVGGTDKDELYNEINSLPANESKIMTYTHYDLMPDIINSANIYANYLRGHDMFFAGISSSLVESLSCNKPALSRNLVHYQGDSNKLGIIPSNEGSYTADLEKLIKRYSKFDNLREEILPHYSWNNQTSRIFKTYSILYKKFYNI